MPVPPAPTSAARRWEMTELAFDADPPADPFAAELTAVFAGPEGAELRVPGFYDGGDRYLVRFSPPAVGGWTYTVQSNLPGLDGRTGRLDVAAAGTKGPIVVDPDNARRFAYADGSPYFLNAFECDWLFALDAEDAGGIPRAEQMIGHIAGNGFNHVVTNVYAHDAGWGEKDKLDQEYSYARPRVFPFGGTNEDPDHSTLNVEFFRRFDRVIEELGRRGVVAHLMIYVWNKRVSWPEAESAADDRYFDYVAKRYQAYPNLVWDISKEALAYGREDMGYVTRRIGRLRGLDAHNRLVTVHDYDYCAAFPETVDYISIQEWTPGLHARMLDVAAEHPGKPVFNIEHGGYERTMDYGIFDGAYNDAHDVLDRAYQTVFAGTYPTYYWQNAAWYHVITDIDALPENRRPHLAWYAHLAGFMRQHDFNKLTPRQGAFKPPMLVDEGRGLYLFYVDARRSGIYGTLPELKDRTMSVAWFDVLTGETHHDGERLLKGWLGVKRPAGWGDGPAVVVLKETQAADAEQADAGAGDGA